MNKEADSDVQTELAALRQRVSNLEAEYFDLLRRASCSRRPAFSRKFLLAAFFVVLLLTAGGVLYGQNALEIDPSGVVNIAKALIASDATVTGKLSAQTLNVTGNATVAGLSVPGGAENLRLLRGNIAADGSKSDGLGFAAGKPIPDAKGLYFVDFGIERFKSVPAASVTAFNQSETGGYNAIIARVSEGGMWVKTVNRNGAAEDRQFSFMVVGVR